MSLDSSVFIVTGYELDSRGFRIQILVGARFFILSMSFRLVLGTPQPLIQWVLGAVSLGVKWPGHEADRSSLTSAEVENTRIYTSTFPYIFMV
jgi:hypothetical protein